MVSCGISKRIRVERKLSVVLTRQCFVLIRRLFSNINIRFVGRFLGGEEAINSHPSGLSDIS